MVSAVVLDLDGVIRHLDVEEAERASQSIGFDFENLMDLLWDNEAAHELLCGRSSQELWWKQVQQLDSKFEGVSQEFLWNDVLAKSHIDLEVIDFVRSVRQDFVTGILTNCSKESKVIILDTLGENHPFDYVLSSSDFGAKKPESEVYRLLLDTIDVSAKECVFFDDRLANVEGAKAVGIQAHLFEGVEQLKRLVRLD